MRILIVHNYTEGFAVGGEANVFQAEAELLEENGHIVEKLFCSNSEAIDASILGKIKYFIYAAWSPQGYRQMKEAIKSFQPDVVHVHNFFLVFSPSIFAAAKDLNVPVVLTLHNYRLIAPCSQLLRDEHICEKCLNINPWRIMLYRCYRKSFLASLLRYRIYYLSDRKHNWKDKVDAYISLTEFGRAKYIEGGLDPERIYVKPNSTEDPQKEVKSKVGSGGYGALYIGTLTVEKGVKTLIDAWETIDYPLTVLGDGGLREELERRALSNVTFLGVVNRETVLEYLEKSAFLVMPSICYESFGLVNIEAMAMNKPIVASRLGAMSSLIDDEKTGLHFDPGNVSDLIEKVTRMIENPEFAKKLGEAGRLKYLENFTHEKNYYKLIEIYNKAIERHEKQGSGYGHN